MKDIKKRDVQKEGMIMKRVLSLFLVLIAVTFCLQSPAIAEVEKAYGTYNSARNGVARISYYYKYTTYTNGEQTDSGYGGWTGSAFAVGKEGEPVRYFVTNRHCVDTSDEITYDGNGNKIVTKIVVLEAGILVDNSGTLLPFDIISMNEDGAADLAVVRLRDATDARRPCYLYPAVEVEKLRDKSPVYSIGYPSGGDVYTKNELSGIGESTASGPGSITKTIIAAQSTHGYEILQTDATINSGNSGGPLVDEKGTVLGVCQSTVTIAQNIHGAVSINELRRFLDKWDVPYETAKEDTGWILYVILGIAIVGVIAVLAVVLRKKQKPATAPKPEPGPKPVKPEESTLPIRILIGIDGPLKDKRYDLKPGGKLLIGRNETCNVRFPDKTPGVSNIHCEIKYDGKQVTIKDLKSSYGTFVDYKKLDPNNAIPLHRSLAIDIGTEQNRFILQ